MTMHVIRFSGSECLSERLSWRLFGRLRRKRIGRLKAVREVREGGFVTWTDTVCTNHRIPSAVSVFQLHLGTCVRVSYHGEWGGGGNKFAFGDRSAC